MSVPELILGGEQIGTSWQLQHLEVATAILKQAGIDRIETVPVYPVLSPGKSEEIFGRSGLTQVFKVDTKIKYNFTGGAGTLAASEIDSSIESSVNALRLTKLDVLYIHGPDRQTDLTEQALNIDAAYRAGRFGQLGICNFDVDMLSKWLEICDERRYVKPTVYSGIYNVLCRTYEESMLPLLRKHNIRFVGASPLASSFLTGRLTFSKSDDDLRGLRSHPSNPNNTFLRYWYDKPSMHKAVNIISEACKLEGVSIVDAALRWSIHHSALKDGDGCIIGPRNPEQLKENVSLVAAGPLPQRLVDVLNGVWDVVKSDAASIVQI